MNENESDSPSSVQRPVPAGAPKTKSLSVGVGSTRWRGGLLLVERAGGGHELNVGVLVPTCNRLVHTVTVTAVGKGR